MFCVKERFKGFLVRVMPFDSLFKVILPEGESGLAWGRGGGGSSWPSFPKSPHPPPAEENETLGAFYPIKVKAEKISCLPGEKNLLNLQS